MFVSAFISILMSVNDFDKYDDELTQREAKNTSETDVNARRYKGITIETLAAWPDDLIVCTLCSPDAGGNLFADGHGNLRTHGFQSAKHGRFCAVHHNHLSILGHLSGCR